MNDEKRSTSVAAGRLTDGQSHRGVGFVAGIAALGGLLFGFDTGIISAALLYIRDDFTLGTFGQQLLVSILLAGALVGVLMAGMVLDRIGRKRTLVVLAAVFTLGAVACALAPSATTLLVARFALGMSVGASSVAVPVYVAEISPADTRGRLVSMYQLLIGVGIFASYIVGYLLSNGQHWRWMLGLAAIPSLLMFVGVLRLPESPRWLISQGDAPGARRALQRILPDDAVAATLTGIQTSPDAAKTSYRQLLNPRYRRAVVLGVVVAATNQLVGVNAVIYYAPTLLIAAGLADSASLLSSIGIGLAIVVFTALSLVSIDRVGRRPLLLGGIAVVVASLIFTGLVYLLPESAWRGPLLVAGLVIYIAAFAASLGIGIWLINSEIFPTAIRGTAASLGSTTHWVLDLAIAMTTLTLFQVLTPSGLFWVFAAFGVAGFLYLFRNLPETKGRSLEEVERLLASPSFNPLGAQPGRDHR
uniref:Major facilitator superfamily (MFS) profile domain-containing protein n=1 Tax=Mycolicibacterium brisbanense TaxID=146020 RepID=B8R4I0_9MYCO|nr:hypothetical protein [Mycolicibacterium brisbanense]